MDAIRTGSVVVGVDSSPCSRAAAEWAADLAALWSAPLHLVHVVAAQPPTTEVPAWLSALLDTADRATAEPTRAEILCGTTVDLLADHAADARLLVIGSYGEGARSGMLAGSVALALLGRVTCPIAIVRGPSPQVPPPRTGPVVVGADGSPAGRTALNLAAGLAVTLGAQLLAVHTWTDMVVGTAARRSESPAILAAEGRAVLEVELAAVAASYPGLVMEPDVVHDTPVRALLDRARDARLLVVGHRVHDDRCGHEPGSGMVHGSTSRALVEFAPCPVVVTGQAAVPPRQHLADLHGQGPGR